MSGIEIQRGGVLTHPAFHPVISVSGPRRWHFLAGRCAVDDRQRPMHVGDTLGQVRRIREIVDAELAAVGATWADVVYQRIFAVDPQGYLEKAAEVLAEAYAPHLLAPGTLVGVTALARPEFLVEIDVLAIT
ncbi:Rid family hydrolase [Streptosporangium sp. NPDC004631]